ncbi:MAG: hypothetical protein ABEK59_08685 [Halobacteria archaeon]
MDRRKFLKLSGATGYLSLTAVVWYKILDNIHFGYGKNVTNQDVSSKVEENLTPASVHKGRMDGYDVKTDHDLISFSKKDNQIDTVNVGDRTVNEQSERIDATVGSQLDLLPVHLDRIRSGEFEVKPMSMDSFFRYTEKNNSNHYATGVLRNKSHVDKKPQITEFSGAQPSDPENFLYSLSDSFQENATYDVHRYVAGSITYHVLMNKYDVRDLLEHDVDYEALNDNEQTAMFCYEFTNRSIEGLHSASPRKQDPPVFAGSVSDRRHKHVYTVVASLVTDGRDVEIPLTFVDYTYKTLYDGVGMDDLLGKDINGYDDHHRITDIYWRRV